MKKSILFLLLGILVGMQAFRPVKNHGVAESEHDLTHYLDVPDSVLMVLKTSCYDCHSNKTDYKWYHEVMPVGYWLESHVQDGKKHLNFSDFSTYSKKKIDHKLEEIEEELEAHKMPMESYLYLHKDAALSEQQTAMIIDWVRRERKKLQESGL